MIPGKSRAPEYEVWASAAGALGALRYQPATRALIQALSVNDIDIRLDAGWALGEIGDPLAVPPLVAILEEGQIPECWAARDALEQIGGPAAEAAVRRHDALPQASSNPVAALRA